MTALVGIQCDGCETTLSKTTIFQANIGSVREHAKTVGWHKTKGLMGRVGYTRDICPECWEKGKR